MTPTKTHSTLQPPDRAILVGFAPRNHPLAVLQESMDELARLVDSAGGVVIGRVTQRAERPSAAYVVGTGKLSEVDALVAETKANLVIFDDELSPSQLRNLEERLSGRPVDAPVQTMGRTRLEGPRRNTAGG
ncbi:MAG: hypothetical protein HZB43_04415 [candidate division Zixibacteria bacterium]|nr:hypothetical protein [candidate division Zixibacteria bacterium]